MKRMVIGAVCAIGLAASAQAVTVVDAPILSPPDRTAISAQEQQFFNQLERDGVEKTLSQLFPSVTANKDSLAAIRSLDADCGTAAKVERYKSVSFGTRAIRDEFMVMMGSCLVKWELTYLKAGVAWKLNNVRFESNETNW
jgi:opacity protein-like surface antigen